MKQTALYIGFLVLFAPQLALAQVIPCSANGYTVVFVNGVFDTLDQARADKQSLEKYLDAVPFDEPINIQLGYNPTHLAGAGDLVQSLAQEFSYSVSDYDLQTILMQIYPEVTTRKLLLVGHSQGAYYTSELYNYLLAHGEPKEAVGVYDVGTPAPQVAGGGKYLNSSSDLLLTYLRDVLHFGALPSNVFIPLLGEDITSTWPGHSFIGAYLAGAPERVVSDISGELSALVPTFSADKGGCFTPPDSTIGYKTQRLIFAVADPTAVIIKTGAVWGVEGAIVIGNTVYNLATTAFNFLSNALPAFNMTVTSDQNTINNFTVVKKLYGSSLDTNDVKELLSNSQGGAVALALPQEKPIAVNGGFVEGTSTGPVSTTTAPSTAVAPFVPAPSGPTQSSPTPAEPTPVEEPASSTPEIKIIPPPAPPAIVINEIEWAGDSISAGRQWIELKNLSTTSVDLSHLVLIATEGGAQYIPLSGIIKASGFFIIERDPAGPINTVANGVSMFDDILRFIPFEPLDNAGEQLFLVQVGDWGTTTVDETPPVSACGGWCAGTYGFGASLSMERVDAHAPGAAASNWASNDTYSTSPNLPWSPQPLYATLLKENSQHIAQDAGWYCAPDTMPILAGQSYAPPPGSLCTYLARFIIWPSQVWSGIFKGTVGSSTLVTLHESWTATNWNFTEGIDPANAQPGDDYFVAIWGTRIDTYPSQLDHITFPTYFETGHRWARTCFDCSLADTGDTNPPTDNYRVVPFTYVP
jgi:hypothetical protein